VNMRKYFFTRLYLSWLPLLLSLIFLSAIVYSLYGYIHGKGDWKLTLLFVSGFVFCVRGLIRVFTVDEKHVAHFFVINAFLGTDYTLFLGKIFFK